eukprot:TRINITY_DN30678_c0_g1_i1.p1 TRINITY_DN30678_c0_g1~~TRINITY_DN30678_c0_g1_i1.p1  ORF type:complete len:531 (+),score=112.11 TRINITY_DN30678_c0_g1_i1:35-1627(+)
MPVLFAEKDPCSMYTECCESRKVKAPNKTILKELKKYSSLHDVEEMDLSTNYVGTKQLMALADFAEKCKKLDTLVASGLCCYHSDLGGIWNGTKEGEVPTGNEAWSHLLEVVKKHPSLTSLDISNNDCGPLIGRLLEDTIKTNENIVDVKHSNVLIDTDTLQAIDKNVEKNVKLFFESHQGDTNTSAFTADSNDPFAESSPTAFSFGEEPKEATEAQHDSCEAVQIVKDHRKTKKTDIGRRVSRSTASFNPEEVKDFEAPVHTKSPSEMTMLRELLKRNLLFAHLHEAELKTVVMALFKKSYKDKEVIMNQGDEGDNMYTISKGTVDIVVEGKKVAQRSEGVSFGELALMYNTPRSATVVADGEVDTWGIDRETYRNIVMSVSIKRRNEYQEVLVTIPFLSSLTQYERLQLADALETMEWENGDVIMRFNEPGEYMYIVLEGTVEVVGREGSKKVQVCRFERGKHFGELEFLNNHRTVADVIAVGKTKTVRLNRKHFELCLGPIKEILRRNIHSGDYAYYRQHADKLDLN